MNALRTQSGSPTRTVVREDFSSDAAGHWKRYLVGNATLEHTGSSLLFVNSDAHTRKYTDAQIDDYHDLPRRRFLWRCR